jgi:alcohol dehydrogenase
METLVHPGLEKKAGGEKILPNTKLMKALVYHGPGKKSWEEKLLPAIKAPTDAIVKILKTTICGTDLHIMKGDVPEVTDGRIIGHEGVGIIEEVGTGVLISKRGIMFLYPVLPPAENVIIVRKACIHIVKMGGGYLVT